MPALTQALAQILAPLIVQLVRDALASGLPAAEVEARAQRLAIDAAWEVQRRLRAARKNQ